MSSDLLPLLSVESLDAAVARYRGMTITAARFIADAETAAAALPQASYSINLAENRYHFLLGWTAACLRQRITLLPSGQGTSALEDLRQRYPDHHVIDDATMQDVLATRPAPGTALPQHWHIPGERVVAITFTSGTTATPRAHSKTWRSLSRNAQLAADEVLGGRGVNIVATVPAQHVYGLENSLISALSAQCCINDRRPFFPHDVRNALESVPGPRTLLTTPTHLKVLVDSGVALPAIHRVVSATAPLSGELARRVEAAWHTQVHEIYGCTEAGVVANRRTTRSHTWRTFGAGTVMTAEGVARYQAAHLPEPVELQDIVESLSDREFVLLGRAADMIKVAGKRASLQDLTRHVLDVPGVTDAVVFVPQPDSRPAALVVAPGIHATQILDVLRRQLDMAFVPRPLVMVDRLPRNDVGKLPREALLQAIAGHRSP